MGLTAAVKQVNGRPMLVLNGVPTNEFWCYGLPNAVPDFVAGDCRICQFHVPYQNGEHWWVGSGQYNFSPIERLIDEFLARAPDWLLIPRVNFGYAGEGWWADQHPDELAVGHGLDGRPVDFRAVRVQPIDCWHSAASTVWTRDASQAMADFVRHFEQRNGNQIAGYQVGAGISAEWFRWWNFIEEVYEDASPVAERGFRSYLASIYGNTETLQAAWGRCDVTLDTAKVPHPARLHTPTAGFFRNPATERDIVDWLTFLNQASADQLLALCAAAKRACGGKKLVGSFFGYFWPHWNTQNPARSGHLALRRVLASSEIDYISSPYAYDNRYVDGVHHAETVPATIERAGKLHVDEIDTLTHLVQLRETAGLWSRIPPTATESCRMLQRDGAYALGTGAAWWMDLIHARWYDDPAIQSTLRSMQALARHIADWPCSSRAEVAWVIDDRSYAYCDLRSDLNAYFTSLGRQFEWSALGFPVDTLMLDEVSEVRPYRVYVFLNAWYADAARRAALHARVRQPGVLSVWFYGAGFVGMDGVDDAGVSAVTGVTVRVHHDPLVPQIDLLPHLAAEAGVPQRFGPPLSLERQQALNAVNPRGWETRATPLFEVVDPEAEPMGHYVTGGGVGLARVGRDGWHSVYCGAPLLPGALLRHLALANGVHAWSDDGATVVQRGQLVALTATRAGRFAVRPPAGEKLAPLSEQADGWSEEAPTAALEVELETGETRFYRVR
ncbi:MAG: hypothetical protein IPM18_11215 [Phycisphaerales bacterium]|nr:hypothetical protein [Phycisphaerales bacterium]